MGLDMYLRASQYVSGYSFRAEEDQAVYTRLVEQFGVGDFVDPETPSASVEFTVGYWRKANQIHQWFVKNVQGGEDECKPHYVSREQLRELRDLCQQALTTAKITSEVVEQEVLTPEGVKPTEITIRTVTNADEVAELMPTQSGFFFGGTEYDEWYLNDLEDTITQIDRVLKMPDSWDFEYQSSW